MFKAIQIIEKGINKARFLNVNKNDFPTHDVLIKVHYSTLNYKDALAITGKSPVVRNFPLIPGIDLSGEVITCKTNQYKTGDKVILNGWGVGESYWGGLSQYASVKPEWLVPLPESLTTKSAMSLGTAGYTAMLCVQAIEAHGISPDDGNILVSGAAGGVGSIATFLLAKRGYQVTASTGRLEESDYLKSLGAQEIIHRQELAGEGKPLQKERWAAAIDVAGSYTLANICASLKYGGVVAACGLAQGMDLPATVAPFILRGISLAGIDSVYQPIERRIKAWDALAQEIDSEALNKLTTEIKLSNAITYTQDLLDGKIKGRLVVDVNS